MEKHDFREVLQKSPFFPRVDAMSQIKVWSDWNGYQTARVYDAIGAEYFSVRSSCSVMDLTPMGKYRIKGPDAEKFLTRLVTRDITSLKPGRVTYVVWCNDEGKVLDDGTIFHLGEEGYRLCAQHHQLDWLLISALGMDVSIDEETHEVAALSIQGPTSCSVLEAAGISGLANLKPFGIMNNSMNGFEVMVSRTGFTGDLGYEVWTDPENALPLWDAIFGVKERGLYDVRPIGLNALEMVRIEAGFIVPGDDFNPADSAVRADKPRSPFELGLGWAVDLDKPNFTGKRALLAEKQQPIKRRLVKLSVEGNKLPADSFLYNGQKGQRIGTIKTAIWSPMLKSNLAIAEVEYIDGKRPKDIWAEIYYQKELDWKVVWKRCHISTKPFWNPPHRNATPPERF